MSTKSPTRAPFQIIFGIFFGNEIWFYHYLKIFSQSLSFCASSRAAFQLVMRNLLRVVVLDSVTDLLLLIGKLVVVLLCGSTSYLAFHGHIPEVKLRQNKFDVKKLPFNFNEIIR